MLLAENSLVPDHTKVEAVTPNEPNFAYIGENVRIKGEISVPDRIVLDGTIEGDLTARTVRIGPSGAIIGKLIAAEAEIYGSITEKAEIKQLLTVRSSGRITGEISYGELQLDKGAIITGAFSSTDFHTETNGGKSEPAPAGKPERPNVTLGAAGRLTNGTTLNAKKDTAEAL